MKRGTQARKSVLSLYPQPKSPERRWDARGCEAPSSVLLSVQLVNHALRGVNEQLTIGAAESSSLD